MNMKYLNKILFILTIGMFVFSACDRDGLPLPDGMKNGVIATIAKTANCDGSIDLFNPDDLFLEYTITIQDGGYTSLDLMVVRNGDYENQYVVKSVTEGVVTSNMAELLSAVDELSSTADLQPGDLYNYFLKVVSSDGTVYSAYLPGGEPGYGANMQNNPNFNFNVNILAAFPYVAANFVGTYHVVETQLADGTVGEYDVEVELDPDNPEYGLRIWDLWWGTDAEFDCFYTVYINPDTYEILADFPADIGSQIIWGGNAFGSYGRVSFGQHRNGLVNTATNVLTFIVTPRLPDTGFWWGTECLYVITKTSKTSGQGNVTRKENIIKE